MDADSSPADSVFPASALPGRYHVCRIFKRAKTVGEARSRSSDGGTTAPAMLKPAFSVCTFPNLTFSKKEFSYERISQISGRIHRYLFPDSDDRFNQHPSRFRRHTAAGDRRNSHGDDLRRRSDFGRPYTIRRSRWRCCCAVQCRNGTPSRT